LQSKLGHHYLILRIYTNSSLTRSWKKKLEERVKVLGLDDSKFKDIA
jgi:hypothetical protein